MLKPVQRIKADHSFSMNPLEDMPRVASLKRGGKDDNAGYFQVIRKGVLISPPGLLGWHSTVEPDTKFGPKFTANIHWTQEQASKFALQVASEMAILIPKLAEEIAPKKLKEFHADPWLEDKLKSPNEKNRIQLPFVHFSTNASWTNRDKEVVPVTIKAYDPKNNLLDLPSLHLGMGSTVQIVYQMKAYTNGLLKGKVEPSLKLFGIRVLKLEQFGAGSQQLSDLSEEDMVGLEEGFEAEDLTAFAMGAKTVTQKIALEEDEGISGEDF